MSELKILGLGVLLGWGAAIPVGPISLEIVRRNLSYGALSGVLFGTGACLADVTYLTLWFIGVLSLFQDPGILRVISLLGAFVLFWFAYQALTQSPKTRIASTTEKKPSLWREGISGYLMTLLNPMTIVFWGSVSAPIALMTNGTGHGMLWGMEGLLIGTFSWVLGLNIMLSVVRHKLSRNVTKHLNHLGGVILLIFAILGCWRAIA
jgi:L-lysine exporter family protein LysE/ArgO